MRIPFVKMSGAGNDMVVVDHRRRFLVGRESALARLACDRARGVGADALVLIEDDSELDCRVRFFNPDGGEYDLCGNAARCLPLFAVENGIGSGERGIRFRTGSGVHRAVRIGPDAASVTLPPVTDCRFDIPVELDGRPATMDWGNIGVPHGVHWVEDVDRVPIERWGPHLRSHPAFDPEGTNVSFAARLGPDRLAIRTFERGVEGETLACGSGSAVVATLARQRGWIADSVRMQVRSGDELVIRFGPDAGERGTELEGPVRRLFASTLEFPAPGEGPAPGIGNPA